ncbi:hypothetical protein pipiens_005309 [Culex pipiens pipiens]|uniref:Uncharacterized protein n=1 Tax=Culex pipiens pipiens TaxID=38569 RepID=A0ABD1DXT3_CULPP
MPEVDFGGGGGGFGLAHYGGAQENIVVTDQQQSSDHQQEDGQSNNGGTTRRKIELRTPMDFSEAETISSGFSDKISSKTTQMDERPRNFLCTMADPRRTGSCSGRSLGCRRRRRITSNQLPLLDDQNPFVGGSGGKAGTPKVPPVTPAGEEPPSEFGDDTRSVISSAVFEQSFAMSECITYSKRKEIAGQLLQPGQHLFTQLNGHRRVERDLGDHLQP